MAVAFLPLAFVAIVWRPTSVWCRRLTDGLLAVILSKFVLAVAFTLAAGAIGQGGDADGGGLSAVVGGGAVLLIAALLALGARANDPADAERVRSGHEPPAGQQRDARRSGRNDGLRRRTDADVQPLRRLAPAAMAAGSPQVGAAARRGATPSGDVPVAVIPEPAVATRKRP